MEVKIDIDGKPVPKARPRMTRRGVVYTPKTTLDAEARIRSAFISEVGETDPTDKPIVLEVAFFYEPPKSWSKIKRASAMLTPKVSRPDVDNLVKTVMDGLNGVAWVDDSQVCYIKAMKYYAEADKTSIKVSWRDYG